jgi:DNA-directed RNA polymerase specialized sigma subunit
MKIPLNLRQNEEALFGEYHDKAMERDVLACKKSDWEAKARLVHTFMPLLTSLARKRTADVPRANRYIEAGKEGLMTAVRKFRPSRDIKFRVFALEFIETNMDRTDRRGGVLARLFGRGP